MFKRIKFYTKIARRRFGSQVPPEWFPTILRRFSNNWRHLTRNFIWEMLRSLDETVKFTERPNSPPSACWRIFNEKSGNADQGSSPSTWRMSYGTFSVALWCILRRSISQHSIDQRGRHCCLWRTLENGREAGNNKRNENEKKRPFIAEERCRAAARRWHE